MQPLTKRLVELLPNQYHSKAVEVDQYLRVRGAPKGTVYAIGDAATVSLLSTVVIEQADGAGPHWFSWWYDGNLG